MCGQAADADAAKQHVPTREELKAHEAEQVRAREREAVRTQGLSNQPRTIALRSDWSSVRALVCGQRAEERRRNRPAEPANPKAKGGVPSMLTRDKSAPASLGGSAGMGAGRLQRPGMA